MERTITTIQEHARELNLTGLAVTVEVLLEEARKSEPSYSDFALILLETERSYRQKAKLERRRKIANLPLLHDLDHYDSSSTVRKIKYFNNNKLASSKKVLAPPDGVFYEFQQPV